MGLWACQSAGLCGFERLMGRTHGPVAMQKVVGSSPIIRFMKEARSDGLVVLVWPEALDCEVVRQATGGLLTLRKKFRV